ncbi:hypothetical protein LIER_32646 [Lithospermum erythrorhizon]|uniref:Uncharacterized protein n=1 Tax=Lithospermum erythrorhizon TaxID=34254 RepID=A0AAV3RUG1_LITER
MYIIGTLLNPNSNFSVSLQYAEILNELENLKIYNWCKHVIEQLKEGLNQNRKSANGDIHFLLVNYLDHMGSKSKFKKATVPTCLKWECDVYAKLQDIKKLVGYGCGISAGAVFVDPNHDEKNVNRVPTIMPFDVDNCPLHKVFSS